jgi:hypothetical protein
VDANPSLACTAPCSLGLARGRHSLKASLAGYRDQVRFFEVPDDLLVSVALAKPFGTLWIRTRPPGVDIFVNNVQRPEKTPAKISLPVGRYHLALVHNGRKVEQMVDVADDSTHDIQAAW